MRVKLSRFLLFCTVLLAPLGRVSAAPGADVAKDKVEFRFPETATFSAELSSDANIVSVTLEYGDEQLTCGDVVAKAFPQFNPGKTVSVEWTWDMRQSGSLLPGTTIWWRWRFADETGAEFVSDEKTAVWLDNNHNWQTINSTFLRLHYYGLDSTTAQDLLKAGEESLDRNKQQAGLKPDAPIDIYIYASYQDLRDAILYEPQWTGGQADAAHNIVIVGLSQFDHEYDRNVVIHELTHVLIGRFTFSCLSDMPSWLEEGLAVYSEGKLDAQSQAQFDNAIRTNDLLSVRSLSAGFSEEYGQATLSYSQSYSLVKFLIETYGQEKMTLLLTTLQDGKAIDDALLDVYGFDVEGLEDEWRKAIGAAPRTVSAQPTAQPTPTHVPTIVPVSGAPLAVTATPFAIPTSSFEESPSPTQPASRTAPPLWMTLSLVGGCCLILLVVGVVALGIFVRSQNRKGGSNG